MPLRVLLALATVAAVAAGCGGGDPQEPPAPLLTESSFAEIVAAEIKKGTELRATPGPRSTVRVEEGLNSVEVGLEAAFAEYREDPERRDEIVAGVVAEARGRIESGIEGESFAAVEADLMPLLKPPFALRRLPAEPAERRFAGSLVVVYAVDRGADFTIVTSSDLARWGKSVEEIDSVALENLAARTEELLCEEELCGWASGDGYDATRMISPDLREDITDEIGPAVYAVPQENVFVALPIELADRIRAKVLEQFTTADNPVSSDLFVEEGGELVVLPR